MKRTVPVFIVVFLYTAIFVKICFNLSVSFEGFWELGIPEIQRFFQTSDFQDIMNNQRVFRQRNFLKALNKLTQEVRFLSFELHEIHCFNKAK